MRTHEKVINPHIYKKFISRKVKDTCAIPSEGTGEGLETSMDNRVIHKKRK